MIIELKAHIDEQGKIIFQTPVELPVGDVEITITYHTEEELEDEALWDRQFSDTPTSALDALIEDGLNAFRNGETDLFDPNLEDD
jgi:hypothetical protein